MTGPCEGKLKLDRAKIIVCCEEDRKKLQGAVYIHLKGYARARVTHLDIESNGLEELIGERGKFLNIYGINDGLRILISKRSFIDVVHPLINEVLKKGERTRTWVGMKEGGIYIGFRKPEVKKLERLAERAFGMKPSK
ncbi:hypothetical protein DRN86_03765 [Candidatus Geothermarchaeota archaeon]|nr:MAG: hypothetical protein DRN86_03765 [Candidatus Geothermarchaeota archaeon]